METYSCNFYQQYNDQRSLRQDPLNKQDKQYTLKFRKNHIDYRRVHFFSTYIFFFITKWFRFNSFNGGLIIKTQSAQQENSIMVAVLSICSIAFILMNIANARMWNNLKILFYAIENTFTISAKSNSIIIFEIDLFSMAGPIYY